MAVSIRPTLKFQSGGETPDESYLPNYMNLPEIPVKEEEEEDPMDEFKFRARSSNLHEVFSIMRGNDDDKYFKFIDLLGTFSHTETGRNNINAKNGKDGKPTSSAKGIYQMTDAAFKVDKQRIRNALKAYPELNRDIFKNIFAVDDIKKLSKQDQSILTFMHIHYSPTIPFTQYLEGTTEEEDTANIIKVYDGWVGDPNGSVYANNEHLKNLSNKRKEIQKKHLNRLDTLVPYVFNEEEKEEDEPEFVKRHNREREVKLRNGGLLYQAASPSKNTKKGYIPNLETALKQGKKSKKALDKHSLKPKNKKTKPAKKVNGIGLQSLKIK